MPDQQPTLQERPLRVLSLFSGIGGLDLGLERAGMQVVCHSETDPYACLVLAKHWPGVYNVGDIVLADFQDEALCDHIGSIDVIAGGFPCQDISKAGKRAGIEEGVKSGLWREFARAIREIRPKYVIVENAADLVIRGLGTVLSDLAACGYDTEWRRVSAAEFGAPHDRRRTFIVAYPHGHPLRLTEGPWPERPRAAQLEHTSSDGTARAVGSSAWGFVPDLGGVVHGLPDWVDRLRGLGNAVVPAVAEHIGRIVVEHHRRSGVVAA